MSADVQDTDKFANLAEKICPRLSIRYRLISKIHGGGHSTFRVDDSCVIKIYTYSGSPEYTMRKESQLLQSIAHHTSVPVPAVEATGVLDGFSYMFLSIVSGEALHRVLKRISNEDRHHLLSDVGRVIRHFHDHRPAEEECPDFDDMYFSMSDWWNYLERRKLKVLKKIEPASHAWSDLFTDFVDRSLSTTKPDQVFLHGDLQSAHIIVKQTEGRWVVSGVIDVPKASMGAPEYDWAYLPDCIGWEQASLLPVVLSAYGCEDEMDENFANRLLVNYCFGPQDPLVDLLNSRINRDIEPGDYAELAKRLFLPDGRQTLWKSRFH